VLGGALDLPGWNLSGSLQMAWALPLQPVVAQSCQRSRLKPSSIKFL
jgi:hypothetical protein